MSIASGRRASRVAAALASFRLQRTSGQRLFKLVRHADDGRFSEKSLFETDLPYLAHAAPPPRLTL